MLRGMVVAASAALATTALASAGTSSTTVTTLHGTVGPGFTIKLTKAGQPVTRLQPGAYRIVVADRSPAHNFVLERSGGFERQVTSVPFVGTKTITVTLTRGQWEFYCAPHAPSMKGHFGVGVAVANASDDGPNHQ
jgi:plastocyanin